MVENRSKTKPIKRPQTGESLAKDRRTPRATQDMQGRPARDIPIGTKAPGAHLLRWTDKEHRPVENDSKARYFAHLTPEALEYLKQEHPSGKLGEGVISAMFGVSLDTVYRWFTHDLDLIALREVRAQQATEEVERALYQRAKGYTYTERTETEEDGGKDGPKRRESIAHKQLAPDPAAARTWLEAHRPDLWRQQVHHTHTLEGYSWIDLADDPGLIESTDYEEVSPEAERSDASSAEQGGDS